MLYNYVYLSYYFYIEQQPNEIDSDGTICTVAFLPNQRINSMIKDKDRIFLLKSLLNLRTLGGMNGQGGRVIRGGMDEYIRNPLKITVEEKEAFLAYALQG